MGRKSWGGGQKKLGRWAEKAGAIGSVFDTNVLTVIASGSYEQFA